MLCVCMCMCVCVCVCVYVCVCLSVCVFVVYMLLLSKSGYIISYETLQNDQVTNTSCLNDHDKKNIAFFL